MNSVINGLEVIPLKKFKDERGMVLHMLRADSAHFEKFGEVYFSFTNPGFVKAWKKHKIMAQNYAVPQGTLKLVIFDDREKSPTKGLIQELILNLDNYSLVKIPPGLWYGFEAISDVPAMIVNCATLPHDPSEVESLEANTNKIPYSWKK